MLHWRDTIAENIYFIHNFFFWLLLGFRENIDTTFWFLATWFMSIPPKNAFKKKFIWTQFFHCIPFSIVFHRFCLVFWKKRKIERQQLHINILRLLRKKIMKIENRRKEDKFLRISEHFRKVRLRRKVRKPDSSFLFLNGWWLSLFFFLYTL